MEKYEFKTEVKQLLDLMVHSLYSHKEVFLRELISNASDAIDRARYESLTNSAILEDDGSWKIKIYADKEKGILTVSDNGIGMTKEEIIEALGTIAHSGTKEFIMALKSKDIKDNPELIGQFGVGFYSSFMVADKITVLSRKAGQKDKRGVKWESTGDGTFNIEEIDKPQKGTDVILHLKDEEKKYLNEWEIRSIVKRYSDFIEHPIVMEVEKEKESELEKGKKFKVKEEETLNSRKAIWLKDKSEITQEEYNEFYKHISHDFKDPLKVIHYKAEGTSEFTALLYIPSKAPFNILFKDFKVGPMLYVKRVQIMEHCEDLIMPYLRFIRGVVDSSDLPLNVSREILQNNRQVEIIKNNVTKKVLDTLEEMKNEEYEKYLNFYKEFGKILKEGLHYDFSRKE
ncbi:MAG TPA: molecular chaperone HtpG, partial [Syntrophorhabdaceae bacterium]|nr:molecular chaperone HtpG [Syntrophorhabdaceae bacterium]